MKAILDGKEIETTTKRIADARHACVFVGGMNVFMQGLSLDSKGVIRCNHCGQLPHETSIPALRRLLSVN